MVKIGINSFIKYCSAERQPLTVDQTRSIIFLFLNIFNFRNVPTRKAVIRQPGTEEMRTGRVSGWTGDDGPTAGGPRPRHLRPLQPGGGPGLRHLGAQQQSPGGVG